MCVRMGDVPKVCFSLSLVSLMLRSWSEPCAPPLLQIWMSWGWRGSSWSMQCWTSAPTTTRRTSWCLPGNAPFPLLVSFHAPVSPCLDLSRSVITMLLFFFPWRYQPPNLAISALYWKAWLLLLVVAAFNPQKIGIHSSFIHQFGFIFLCFLFSSVAHQNKTERQKSYMPRNHST